MLKSGRVLIIENYYYKVVYPLPPVEHCLDTLADNCWFSKCLLAVENQRLRLQKNNQAFITKYELYEFHRMAYGLCGAPATFARH